MGSGARAQRIVLGQVRGESIGIQEHALAMIPIEEQQAAAQLEIRKVAFEQELKQAEQMNLLSQKLSGRQSQPVFVTQAAGPVKAANGTQPNYTIIIALGILAFMYFKKGKLL